MNNLNQLDKQTSSKETTVLNDHHFQIDIRRAMSWEASKMILAAAPAWPSNSMLDLHAISSSSSSFARWSICTFTETNYLLLPNPGVPWFPIFRTSSSPSPSRPATSLSISREPTSISISRELTVSTISAVSGDLPTFANIYRKSNKRWAPLLLWQIWFPEMGGYHLVFHPKKGDLNLSSEAIFTFEAVVSNTWLIFNRKSSCPFWAKFTSGKHFWKVLHTNLLRVNSFWKETVIAYNDTYNAAISVPRCNFLFHVFQWKYWTAPH